MTTPLPISPTHLGLTSPGNASASYYSHLSSRVLTTGEQMERKSRRGLLRAHGHHDGVPRIVTSRASRAYIELRRQNIDELPLALVAPLGPEDDGHCSHTRHVSTPHSYSARRRFRTAHRSCSRRAEGRRERYLGAVRTIVVRGRVILEFCTALARPT